MIEVWEHCHASTYAPRNHVVAVHEVASKHQAVVLRSRLDRKTTDGHKHTTTMRVGRPL
jgi:hypothetical protein